MWYREDDWDAQSYTAGGTTRADATQLGHECVRIASVSPGGGVILQNNETPSSVLLFNADAMNSCKVYQGTETAIFNPDRSGTGVAFVTIPPGGFMQIVRGSQEIALAVPLTVAG